MAYYVKKFFSFFRRKRPYRPLKCLETGEASYNEFKSTRFDNKTLKLFDNIPKIRKQKRLSVVAKKIDVKIETILALRTIRLCKTERIQHI